jgi:hypothetical protein
MLGKVPRGANGCLAVHEHEVATGQPSPTIDELTGDFGDGLETTSIGDLRLVWSICGKLTARHFETVATLSAQSGPDIHHWRCRLIGGKRNRPLKATSVSKSKSDSIAECVQKIVLSLVVLVAYSKAFDLVAEVIA